MKFDSLSATLFITVLFLLQLTENQHYQLVIKEQAVPWEVEAALNRLSQAPSQAVCVTKHGANVA
ncbi:MAG: hypothetical protein AB1547_00135 [Thermodesulfobacteriota bacterium]